MALRPIVEIPPLSVCPLPQQESGNQVSTRVYSRPFQRALRSHTKHGWYDETVPPHYPTRENLHEEQHYDRMLIDFTESFGSCVLRSAL